MTIQIQSIYIVHGRCFSMFQFTLRMFYMMGIKWQLLTHLAVLDALLVTKKTNILHKAVTPAPSAHTHLDWDSPHFTIGRTVPGQVPDFHVLLYTIWVL